MGNTLCGLPQFLFTLEHAFKAQQNKAFVYFGGRVFSLHFPNIKMLIPSMPVMTPFTNGFTFDYA